MSRQEPAPFLFDGDPPEPRDMRRANRHRILRSIITRGPATRAELARRTGMSRPTVSVIANELLTSGVLSEGERVSSGGAPGTLLEISKDGGVTLVVDLRLLEDITLATVSASGEVITRRQVAAESGGQVLAAVERFAAGIERPSLIGAAITVHGFVDQRGVWRHNAGNTLDLSVIDDLRRMLRMPVFPINATDAITIADLRDSSDGLAAQATVVLSKIALGLMIEGRLLIGVKRPAGDLAHIVPGTPGPVCDECHRRCLSAMVGRLFEQDSPTARAETATGIAAVMAPISAAVELEEIALALAPPGIAEELAGLIAENLQRLLPADRVPNVRLSGQGHDGVLVGAANMMLYSRLG